jgi:ribosome biogenesis protein ERB1
MGHSTQNTSNDVPEEWYRHEEHVGYNLHGKKMIKEKPTDSIENFLASVDVRDSWRKILDTLSGNRVLISRETLELVRKISAGIIPANSIDILPNSNETRLDPFNQHERLTSEVEPKRRFLPSVWESKLILKLTRKLRSTKDVHQSKKSEENDHDRLLWHENSGKISSSQKLRAPKVNIPSHVESYNPLIEYISDQSEMKVDKFQPLRSIPTYSDFLTERFYRCLDLYLCPRVRKHRAQTLPGELLSSLTESTFSNFPTKTTLEYKDHKDYVQHLAVHMTGNFLASSEKRSVRIWEIATGRIIKILDLPENITGLMWRPLHGTYDISVCMGKVVLIFSSIISRLPLAHQMVNKSSMWEKLSIKSQDNICVWQTCEGMTKIEQKSEIKNMTWHQHGEYFATVADRDLIVHRMTQYCSQNILVKQNGAIFQVLFSRSKPTLFAAASTEICMYDLLEQTIIKKFVWQSGNISCIGLDPFENYLIAGSHNAKVAWFDIDSSSSPLKIIASHSSGIKTVMFHERLSIFATASADEIHLFHWQIDNLFVPTITPLKIVKNKIRCDPMRCAFHPNQPWLFLSREDKSIVLYCEALLK